MHQQLKTIDVVNLKVMGLKEGPGELDGETKLKNRLVQLLNKLFLWPKV